MNKVNEIEEEVKSLKTELSAANLTISNIQNALNLPGKKGISLEVIELVNELVSENAAHKRAFRTILHNSPDIYEATAVMIAHDEDFERKTTADDSAIAEIKAQAVLDAIDAMSDSGALTLGDAVIAMTAYSARLREGKA